jgi:hypothetical protein
MKNHISQESNKPLSVKLPVHKRVYATPLTAITERDWEALVELFDREDSDDIEANIQNALQPK